MPLSKAESENLRKAGCGNARLLDDNAAKRLSTILNKRFDFYTGSMNVPAVLIIDDDKIFLSQTLLSILSPAETAAYIYYQIERNRGKNLNLTATAAAAGAGAGVAYKWEKFRNADRDELAEHIREIADKVDGKNSRPSSAMTRRGFGTLIAAGVTAALAGGAAKASMNARQAKSDMAEIIDSRDLHSALTKIGEWYTMHDQEAGSRDHPPSRG